MIQSVLIKVSGEMLSNTDMPFSKDSLLHIYTIVSSLQKKKINICCVVGGGNIMRGRSLPSVIKRESADYMGMMATMINGLAIESYLNKKKIATYTISSLKSPLFKDASDKHGIEKAWKNGDVVICVGGTGTPGVTTDTAAASYAKELKVDLLIKCTTVDGVYTKDPKKYSDAIHLPLLTHEEAIKKCYRVMDMEAFSICKKASIPIIVTSHQNVSDIIHQLTTAEYSTDGYKGSTLITKTIKGSSKIIRRNVA